MMVGYFLIDFILILVQVGPIVASVAHGIVYYVAPPWGH